MNGDGLPPCYVPPEPTHPTYGYLTPEELAELAAAEELEAAERPPAEAGGPRLVQSPRRPRSTG